MNICLWWRHISYRTYRTGRGVSFGAGASTLSDAFFSGGGGSFVADGSFFSFFGFGVGSSFSTGRGSFSSLDLRAFGAPRAAILALEALISLKIDRKSAGLIVTLSSVSQVWKVFSTFVDLTGFTALVGTGGPAEEVEEEGIPNFLLVRSTLMA